MQWIKTDNLCDTGIGGSGKGGMFQMWTVSRIVAMVILTGLSFMDYKIRKVPRDVLLLCMAGTVLYQAVTLDGIAGRRADRYDIYRNQ